MKYCTIFCNQKQKRKTKKSNENNELFGALKMKYEWMFILKMYEIFGLFCMSHKRTQIEYTFCFVFFFLHMGSNWDEIELVLNIFYSLTLFKQFNCCINLQRKLNITYICNKTNIVLKYIFEQIELNCIRFSHDSSLLFPVKSALRMMVNFFSSKNDKPFC